MKKRIYLRRWLVVLLLVGMASPLCGQSNVRVTGLGWLMNREFGQMLSFINDVAPNEMMELSTTVLEDNAFILLARLGELGYLDPRVEVTFYKNEEEERSYSWQTPYQPALPRDYTPESAVFRIVPGVRAYYESVDVTGIDFMGDDSLEAYFIPGNALFRTRASRYFTEKNLRDRIDTLLVGLENLGYRSAKVKSREVVTEPESGATVVQLEIELGPRYFVRAIEVVDDGDGAGELKRTEIEPVLHTRVWLRDLRQEKLNAVVALGYPDATIRSSVIEEEVIDEETVERVVVLTIQRGPTIQLGSVRFILSEKVRESVLRRQAALRQGEPLDLIEANEARRRLLGLGVFRTVRMDQEEVEEGVRDILFTPEPGMRREFSVLGGWGSYEMARVGFLWRHNNAFSRAHRYDVDGKQSLKARNLGTRYTIPQIFGTSLEAFSRLRYSAREELTFDRETATFALGTSVVFPRSGVFSSFEYTIERQNVSRRELATRLGPERATVAGFQTRVGLDRRDNAIYPGKGYSVSLNTLVSSEYLGGQVDFQKIDLGASYHLPFGNSRTIHVGLRYGAIFAFGSADANIPFNERFFLGGEGTQRGFQQGEASPLDDAGNQLGAEAYVLANLELEQRIIGNFSVVTFADALGTSLKLSGWGTEEFLYAAGLGLRYRSPVGPIRLEYGRNLNPRSKDPSGTLHFSIGFPF